jgi:hypothetical protein
LNVELLINICIEMNLARTTKANEDLQLQIRLNVAQQHFLAPEEQRVGSNVVQEATLPQRGKG